MIKLNRLGFSLIELMIGIGVSAAVSLAGAYVAVQTTKVSTSTSLQTELNQEHIIALQRLRDTDNLLDRIGLNNNNVNACFTQGSRTFNCTNLNMPNLQVIGFDFATCVGNNCNFDHELEYRLDCANPSRCNKLELKLTTSLRPAVANEKQYFAKDKISHIFMSAMILQSRAQIDFSCTAGNQIITEFNFNTLVSVCNGYVADQVCNSPNRGNPIKQIGTTSIINASCQTMAAEVCNTTGFSSLGNFRNQNVCNLGGTGAVATLANCNATTATWNNCSAAIVSNGVEGTTVALSDNVGPDVGSASFVCSASGSWTLMAGSDSCNAIPVASNCTADASLKWGAFTYNVPGNPLDGTTGYLCEHGLATQTVASGQNFVAQTANSQFGGGFSGQATFSCLNGNWTYQNGTCTMTPVGNCCAGAAAFESVNCFGTVAICPGEPNYDYLLDPCSEGGLNQTSGCTNLPPGMTGCENLYGPNYCPSSGECVLCSSLGGGGT